MSDQRRLPAGAQGGAPGDPRSPLVGRTSDLCSSGTDPTPLRYEATSIYWHDWRFDSCSNAG
jgi:hypothetical protein